MNQYSSLKNALIAFFLLLSVLYALPNIFGSDLAVQVSSAGDKLIAKSDLDKITDTLKVKVLITNQLLYQTAVFWCVFDDNASQLSAKDTLKTALGRNYVVALNLAPSVPLWLSNLGGKAMSLGLDLRGGVHFLLEVDMHAVMAMSIDKHYNELRTLLRAERLYKSIKKEDERIVIRLKTADSKDRALKIISSELSAFSCAREQQ
ncbi:Protein-export membrane protein SecD (TC 3.A.5.1.1) [uncultured Gammaproteobacteria bacterium]|nr:Protein-export membrane protein SecD (TC 3.A.5.1.1) [uncultured Gammaproteobacteria bacterium]